MKNFIAECHRRRVFRVAALYVVGAWVVLQVASLAFDSWGIPSSVLQRVWLGAIIGFPAALIFGWRFDFVGGRIVRTLDDSATDDFSLHPTDYLILTALAVVILAMVYGVGTEISTHPVSGPDQKIATINAKSIAVLPFSNVSPGEDDAAFLAIGIQDDLLTRLSKIGDLKVISRTSVERYRDTTKSILRIGKELGVGKILEGGVQRSDDNIRINVQLIDAATDTHVWAETYDRSLTAGNVFAVQTEIVEEIVNRLQATLTPEEAKQLTAMPTQNLAAYTVYLKGRSQSSVESIKSLNAAIENFKAAIELDPHFALAYVGLADAYLTLGANFLGGLPVDESNALAEPPLTKALDLDPDLGEAYATLGLLKQQQGNWEAAEHAYQTAISLQPSYARVFRLYGRLRQNQGKIEESMEFFQKALVLDPYSAPVNVDLGRAYDALGYFDPALQRFLRVVEIEPDHAFAYVYIAAIHYLAYGQVDESLIWYHKAAENDPLSPSLQAAQAIAYLELGDPDSAKMWIDRGLELGPRTFWAVWASALFNLYTGDEVATQADARTLLEVYPRNWGSLFLLRNVDLAAGRYDVARSRYARAFRELTEAEVPEVNVSNYQAAVDLALVLIRLGEQERANDLLAGSLEVIDTLPRHGMNGYWITDARIYSLQQRPQQALNALRQAVDEGWRIFSWLYLQHDPGLDAIRAEPEFQRLYAELQADLAAQAERVRDLKASGELSR
ncbi:MAG: tetratricopeptide repeat protein [Gammaproteobacteria bacterium]|nr:tetratricopeptide repeat protein [Gammaproteobacteria bacterium]